MCLEWSCFSPFRLPIVMMRLKLSLLFVCSSVEISAVVKSLLGVRVYLIFRDSNRRFMSKKGQIHERRLIAASSQWAAETGALPPPCGLQLLVLSRNTSGCFLCVLLVCAFTFIESLCFLLKAAAFSDSHLWIPLKSTFLMLFPFALYIHAFKKQILTFWCGI